MCRFSDKLISLLNTCSACTWHVQDRKILSENLIFILIYTFYTCVIFAKKVRFSAGKGFLSVKDHMQKSFVNL